MKAIILAGGKGTRFLPLTETIPKALIPIGEKTLIEHVLDSLPETIDTVIITTKYLGEKIQEKIGSEYNGKKILYAEQPKESGGTWAAFFCTRSYIDENEKFCVLNCDDVFKKEEIERIVSNNAVGMGITKTVMPAKYHSIAIDSEGIVTGLERHTNSDREELVTDTFANGFFLLDTHVFSFAPVALIDGELGLPQTLLAHKNEYLLRALELPFWQPCNTPNDLEKIKSAL